MKLTSFTQTKDGATATFSGATQAEVASIVSSYLQANGFRLEEGTSLHGTWGKGSVAGRVLAGGFSGRKKYKVACSNGDPVAVAFSSAMSGWSGSWLGVIKERRQRKAFAEQLRADFTSSYG